MALFAVGIAGTFFTFLWKRNWVFYPPSDFPSASVESYVAAMSGGADLNLSRLTDSVGLVFDDDSLSEKLNHAVMLPDTERGEAIRQIVEELRGNAVEEIKASALRFDARPLMGDDAPMWEEIYNEDTPVDVWLNRVAAGAFPSTSLRHNLAPQRRFVGQNLRRYRSCLGETTRNSEG